MRTNKKKILRPKCDSCVERLYQTYSPFRNYPTGKIPSYCPRCGEEISQDKKNQLVKHNDILRLLSSYVVIVF